MFTLIGAAFAQLEKTKAITESPKTFGPVPPTLAELRPLIAQLDEDIKFRECVASYGVGFKAIDQSKAMKNRYWFLLRLDIQKRELNIRSYKVRDIRTAEKHLAEAERERESGAIIDVCLVSVHDMRNLRRAYPNYHLDTTRFLARLNTVLNGASASSASA